MHAALEARQWLKGMECVKRLPPNRRALQVRRTNEEPGSEEYDVVLAVSFTFVRDGAVVDEAERGPGRTSEWEGSRPANPPGVAAGLLFRWG